MKTALVIGASKGIGRAIALRLASDGFDIYASCRGADALMEGVGREIAGTGRRCVPLVFDVTDRDAVRKEYDRVFGETAPDAVVYNAGIAADDVFVLMTPEEWDKVMRTNLDGFYNTVQPLIMNMMANRHGRIVVIGSISGMTGQAGQVNYSASKAALVGAVKALARETGRKNILVNAVAPGVIDTDMTKDLPKEHILPLIPMKRFGRTEEVASVVSFLCGPDASYVNGQVVNVNGGMFM